MPSGKTKFDMKVDLGAKTALRTSTAADSVEHTSAGTSGLRPSGEAKLATELIDMAMYVPACPPVGGAHCAAYGPA